MKSILLVFSLVLLIVSESCSRRPDGVLPDKEMVELIADMEIVEAYMQKHYSGYYHDSIRDSAVQWVLEKHGLTKADFDSTMTWYGRNIDEYRNLFEKVDSELADRQRRISGESVQIENTSDLWPYTRHILISDKASTNNLAFSIPSSEIQKGDKIIWKMRLNGLFSGNYLLGVDYENGTTSYAYQSQNSNKSVEMALQTDTSLDVKRIFGYVRVNEDHSLPVWIDSIALQRTPVDTTQYYRIFSQRKYYGPHKREIKGENADSMNGSLKAGYSLGDSIQQEQPLIHQRMVKGNRLKLDVSPASHQPISIIPDKPLRAISPANKKK